MWIVTVRLGQEQVLKNIWSSLCGWAPFIRSRRKGFCMLYMAWLVERVMPQRTALLLKSGGEADIFLPLLRLEPSQLRIMLVSSQHLTVFIWVLKNEFKSKGANLWVSRRWSLGSGCFSSSPLSRAHICQTTCETGGDFARAPFEVRFCSSQVQQSSNLLWFSAPVGAVMWQRIQICCALFALYSAAPPAHINRLALFPDKSAWCEAKNITQIVGHTGCQSRSIQNRSGWRPSLSPSLPLSGHISAQLIKG